MKRNTILWVDDDAEDLQMMREILLKYNKEFSLVEAHNGRQALDFLENAKGLAKLPCLIILDINMPVLDGKQTLAIIKKSTPFKSIPVVVFTTSSSELDRQFCQRMETVMITKPATYSSLEKMLVNLLDYALETRPENSENRSRV